MITIRDIYRGGEVTLADLRLLYGDGPSPRGLNRVVVVDASLAPVQEIEYGNARPLFCQQDRLYLYRDILIGNALPEGNVLLFRDGGRRVEVAGHVEPNELPPDTPPER